LLVLITLAEIEVCFDIELNLINMYGASKVYIISSSIRSLQCSKSAIDYDKPVTSNFDLLSDLSESSG